MRASRSLSSLVLVVLSLLVTALPVDAQSERDELVADQSSGSAVGGSSGTLLSDDEAQERTQTQSRRSEVEREIELLQRSDVELRAEDNRLAAEITALEARTAQTERTLEGLEVDLVRLRGEQGEVRDRLERQREMVAQRAVAAYMQPSLDTVGVIFATDDLDEVDRRFALLNSVAASERQLIEGQRRLGEDLRRSETEVLETEEELRASREGQQSDLAELRAGRARQEEVRAALELRIGVFQDEADALAAEESRMVQLIAQRQAMATTTTSTTQPPTTLAPTTSTTAQSVTAPSPGPGPTPTPAPAPTPTPTAPPPTTSPPPTSPPTSAPSGGGLAWPTAGPVTSPYGFRWGRLHQGIDIGAPTGQPIVAAAGGTVFHAANTGGYGLLTLIDHHDGRVTAYAHQSRFAVTSGSVSRGQLIGYIGSTGFSTGPHLHFEVRVNGVAVDPMAYLR